MTNKLTIFKNKRFGELRTTEINGEIWFVGKDVAEALGYSKPRNAIAEHVDEDDALKQGVTDSLGRIQQTTIINESGVYSLIFSSKLSSAKEFKHWVTSEVLPSIRKTGSYNISESSKSKQELDIEEKKVRLEEAEYWRFMGLEYSENKTYKQILDAYSTKAVAGTFVLPLPELEEKNYSATEVGQILGISANMVGKIANKLNLKKEGEYGKWYIDKARNSNKEVNSFRYTQKAIDAIKTAI